MSISLRAAARKLGPVIAATAVAASLATGPATAVPAAPPPVDHQLCYTAAGTFTIPAGIRLINQFSPNSFVPSIRPNLAIHCNPAEKILPTGQIFPITNPSAHLACFPLAVTALQPTPTVVVTNQFGSATLVPGQPNLLCAPTWKSLTGPPGPPTNTPPGLNHFTCYPVRMASGVYHPPPVMLQDEFAPAPVNATVNPVPSELCLPTEKILPSGQVFPIIDPATHLLCFPVSQTPIIPRVWDLNQFGTSVVSINATRWLCVPSKKQVVG